MYVVLYKLADKAKEKLLVHETIPENDTCDDEYN